MDNVRLLVINALLLLIVQQRKHVVLMVHAQTIYSYAHPKKHAQLLNQYCVRMVPAVQPPPFVLHQDSVQQAAEFVRMVHALLVIFLAQPLLLVVRMNLFFAVMVHAQLLVTNAMIFKFVHHKLHSVVLMAHAVSVFLIVLQEPLAIIHVLLCVAWMAIVWNQRIVVFLRHFLHVLLVNIVALAVNAPLRKHYVLHKLLVH